MWKRIPVQSTQQLNVRLSHNMRLWTAVAIGSSVTVGMSVYLLLGLIYQDSAAQAPTTYLLTLFFFLPVVLALAERSSVTPGQGGLFNLSRSAGSVALAFSSGWIAVGGLLGLAALFAWEGGLALSQMLSMLFEIEIGWRWLSALLILLIMLRFLSKAADRWKRRTTFVYAAILFIATLLYAAWFGPTATPSTWVYLPSSTFFSAVPFLAISLWGLHFVLDRRDELRRPRRHMLPALLLPVILGGLAGAAAAATLLRYPSMTYADGLALVALAQRLGPLLALLTMLFMLGLGILGANESLVSSTKLMAAMSDDGFLPERLRIRKRIWQRPYYPLLLLVLILLLFVLFLPLEELTSLSAITVVLAIVLVNLQDLFRFRPHLPRDRWPRLPFHPLVPGIAVALGITIIFTQPLSSWLVVAPWLLLGALVYVAYARQGAVSVRQSEVLVSGVVLPVKKTSFRVMVALADPDRAAALIRLGAQIAAAHNGLLLVLQVSPAASNDPPSKKQAEAAWQELSDKIRLLEEVHVPITPLVRLAPSATEGILTTIWEEKIDLVLLGWPVDSVV